jgi:sulfur carrier protein ThiS
MARRNTSQSIKIEVSKLGEETKTITLPKDSTVGTALESAGYPDNASAKISGEPVESDAVLEDGDEIFVGSAVKGGQV